jgi:hypothetical protein
LEQRTHNFTRVTLALSGQLRLLQLQTQFQTRSRLSAAVNAMTYTAIQTTTRTSDFTAGFDICGRGAIPLRLARRMTKCLARVAVRVFKRTRFSAVPQTEIHHSAHIQSGANRKQCPPNSRTHCLPLGGQQRRLAQRSSLQLSDRACFCNLFQIPQRFRRLGRIV